MSTYSVNVGVTYWVEAENGEEAEHKAADLAQSDYGDSFIRNAWVSDAEDIDAA